ncbi:MAG TPA: response regulator, partial [Armatimonadota bacterium]|nr:response regulator [Armatimonadota bacterium]
MQEDIKVLIVDDSEQTRETLRNILSLEKEIQVVGEASDGQEAVQRVAELHPDVVIMDVNMPGVDGIQATERITTDHPDSCVIVMSAAGDQEYLRKAMQAGARDYLIKPFTSDEVRSMATAVVDDVGVEALQAAGITPEDVRAAGDITVAGLVDQAGAEA